MDGKGRTTDNTFIERLFRSVKHEKMYINPLPYKQIEESMYYYNNERSHSSIDISVPLTQYHYLNALLSFMRVN